MLNPFVVAGFGASALLYLLSRTDKGGAVVANFTDAALSKIPRGIRNNNPGNIRRSKEQWKGMSPTQADPEFVQFEGPDARWGVRALGRVLLSYERAGKRTVRDIIARWAPSTENNTDAYVRAVARELAVDAGQVLDVAEYLPRLAAAIIRHENGAQPYALSDLSKWVKLS